MRATHPIELLRIRPLESRVRRKLQARFGEGRMEKDAVGFPRGQKNSDVRRTSPAAYSTAVGLAGRRGPSLVLPRRPDDLSGDGRRRAAGATTPRLDRGASRVSLPTTGLSR